MKPTLIYWIEAGDGDPFCSGIKDRLRSSPNGTYEFRETQIRFPLSAENGQGVFPAAAGTEPALALLALPVEDFEPIASAFFDLARSRRWAVPVVAVCLVSQAGDREKLLRLGAAAVWSTPFDPGEAIAGLLGGSAATNRMDSEVATLRARLGLGQLIGESPAFLAAIKQVPAIAKYQTCVLLMGETGTGKEQFARAIHYNGARAARPFIPVNCGAVPVDLLENEFFGHECGAFTSASSARRGLLKEADEGTLFLDEIDCLPAMAQVKLLRFLQDGHFRPLGSERDCSSDVRVIAATNINLPEAVEAGRFRNDLFYRLNVVTLKLPALRERGEDIVLLARYFLTQYSAKLGAPTREFASGALLKLACHRWPGNVRELENVVQRAIVVAGPEWIEPEDIYLGEFRTVAEGQDFRNMKARAIAEFERTFIRQLLTAHGGNITSAAQAAGKDRRAFWELMRKHKIGVRSSPAARAPAP
ncbi:MAG TPA: sigma-54 dependent transcriptional regulator [Candidatus Acidoferrales bacterium]|nr:sigma-54 dependent transcriptional regulator [Candidatus Acidoferrales bacterium]